MFKNKVEVHFSWCVEILLKPPVRLESVLSLELGDVVQEDEGQHGVWGDSDVVGREALVEGERSTLGHGLGSAVHGTRVWHGAIWQRLHFLDLRLDEIKRQGEGRGEESGDGAGSEDLRGTGDSHAVQVPAE